MDFSGSKFKRVMLLFGAFLFVGLIIVEWQLEFLRSAPRIDRNTLAAKPNLQVLIQPQKAPRFIHAVAEQQTGRSIPAWLVNRALPYEIGVRFYEGKDSSDIQVQTYTSTPHFTKVAYGLLKNIELGTIATHVQWDPSTVQYPESGLLVAEGSVPADTKTSEAVFYQWGESRSITSMPLSGNHFGELIFDNRSGKVYLTMASFMAAHGLDFGDQHTKILASFQFVIDIRANVNVTENDELKIYIGITIQSENKNKLGVGTLRGGIQEVFVELGKKLEANHGIKLSGDSEWNDNIIEFRYTIEEATQVATLLASGQLF